MLTRRNFLRNVSLLGTAAFVSTDFLFASSSISKPIGIQLYTVKDELSKGIEYVVKEIAKAGYQYIETFGFANGQFFGLTPIAFRNLLKKYKLTSPSGHYGMDNYIKTGDFTEVDNAILAAKALGQKYVTLPYIGEGLRKTKADVANIVQKVNGASIRIAKAGLKMAYHSHHFEFEPIEGMVLYEALLQGTNPRYVDFELDIYWAYRAGQDPITWFEKYPGRFALVHVKDMDKEDSTLTTEVGKGNIDFKKLFKKAKTAGIKYYIVEQESFRMPAFESITESAQDLKRILNN